jgi:hypothetical protein
MIGNETEFEIQKFLEVLDLGATTFFDVEPDTKTK